MAILIATSRPRALLSEIKKKIEEKEVKTWAYDADGDFTHTADQWIQKAWLRPHPEQGMLVFGILGQPGVIMTKQIYGLYHGRFIDMLLTHFDHRFALVQATAIGEDPDEFDTK